MQADADEKGVTRPTLSWRGFLFGGLGWVVGLVTILGGVAEGEEAHGYAPAYVKALPVIVAGLSVLPPALAALRRKVALLRPPWAPPILYFLLVFGGPMISPILEPKGAGRAAIKASRTEAASSAGAVDVEGSDHLTAEQRKANYLRPKGRPLLGRPLDAEEERLLSINDPAERARQAIKAHKLDIADEIIAGLTERSRDDPVWQEIRREDEAAAQAEINPIVATEFPAKVKDQWLPQVEGLPTSEPTSMDDVRQRIQFFDLMAANLDGDRQLDANGQPTKDPPTAAVARAKLHAALAHKQALVFPGLRRTYVRAAADKMWVDDVYVRGTGRGVIFSSAMFATNANVQTAQETGLELLNKLRFSTAEYEWCQGCRGPRYDLQYPPDSAVGLWVKPNNFQLVK